MKNDFEIEVNPDYKHYNFTEEDIKYIFWYYYARHIQYYNKYYDFYDIFSIITITSVSYNSDGSHGYIFDISYREDSYIGKQHIYIDTINEYLSHRRNNKIRMILT